MLKINFIISLVFASIATVFGQEVSFDHSHATDGALYLTTVDGNEILTDAFGHEVEMHEVFRLSKEEIEENGWGKTVKRSEADEFRANGGPQFNLIYLDQANGTGVGFDDPVKGAERRNALEAAFQYYSDLIEDIGTADIEIRESFSANPGSNPFAFAAAYYFGSKGFNKPFTKAHIASGNDPYGPYTDGYLQFNFHPNLDYNYVIEANPAPQQYDFYTIALHEILHLLGFTSYATAERQSAASPYVFTTFDEHLVDFNKNEIYNVAGSGASTTVTIPDNVSITNNQLWFELYPGQHAPVYSPTVFNSSSLDHFDNERSEDGGYLMHPSLYNGDAFKMLHEDEVRVLEKMGFQVNYSIATSIEDHNHNTPAKVSSGLYPNPALTNSGVQIDLGEIDANEVLVIVHDMLGREAYSKVVLNAGSGPVTAIDPHNNLTPGMYIVVGSTNDELFNEKLVIR
ncbi:MAG: T9SS type A sorting domain-containing protein [Flavobacteriales bacterium]